MAVQLAGFRMNEKSKYISAEYFTISALIILFAGCRSSPVSPTSVATITVRYSIPSQSHVILTVSNSYNTTVATIIDSVERSGNYSVTWSTAAYPSGIYFYILIAIPVGGGTVHSLTREFIIE